MLSLFMVGGAFAGCTKKDGGEEHTHKYTYTVNADGTHNGVCDCGKEPITNEAHADADKDGKCDKCGAEVSTGGEEHTHKYTYTANADGTHNGVCECGKEPITNEAHADADKDGKCDKCGADTSSEPSDTSAPLPADKKIYVVGDSTVCSFNDNYYLPRYGYGTQLTEYLNVQSNQVVNLAISGRSSLSFLTESNYTTLKTSIAEGDYLIIGFGHNDEKSDDAARFTNPTKSYTDDTTANGPSFQYTLYENYVKLAKDNGATPILCTPIVRYDDKGGYSGAKVHNTADGDYSAAIRTLGDATNTTVIDLTEITKAVYLTDNDEAKYYHAHTSYEGAPVSPVTGNETPSGRDDTHINKFGAKMVAYQFANALKSTDCALKAQVKTDKTAPTKAVDYADAINKNYVKPNYKPFDPNNTTATKLTDNWYATKMGKLGIAVAESTCSATYANNTFTVGETDVKSKFESGADGFAAAFMQVDINKNFTISANVKVKTVNSGLSNSQGGFGIMLRDDILVDTREDALASNYVAAGLLNKKAPIFSRESGTLTSSGSSNAIAANDTHTISIERVGQSVVVKFDTTTKTFTDFDFVAVDNNYMYLCLFANRGLVVEFSKVSFTITGDSQGA